MKENRFMRSTFWRFWLRSFSHPLAVMFFYNLIIYFKLKQVNYLLLSAPLCARFCFASVSGYGKNAVALRIRIQFLRRPNVVADPYCGSIRFHHPLFEVREVRKKYVLLLLAIFPMSVLAAILMATGVLPSAGNNLISVLHCYIPHNWVLCRLKQKMLTISRCVGRLFDWRFVAHSSNSGLFSFNFGQPILWRLVPSAGNGFNSLVLADQYRAHEANQRRCAGIGFACSTGGQRASGMQGGWAHRATIKANLALAETLETVQRQTRVIENKNAELDGFFIEYLMTWRLLPPYRDCIIWLTGDKRSRGLWFWWSAKPASAAIEQHH